MGWITGLLGAITSFLLIPLGFAVGVYIPLVITDTAYQIYNTLGMSNFARQLFGSTNGVGVDWHNGFSQFLLWALIIGVISFVVSILCNTVANWTRNGIKKSVSLARLSYGMLSIVAVPIAFIFLTTLTALIFNAMSGSAASAMISSNERNNFVNCITAYNIKIGSILGIQTFNLDGTQMTWDQSLNSLMDWIKNIQQTAASQGMTGLQNECDKIIQDITAVQTSCSSTYMQTQLNALISIANGMTIGQRLSDMSGLQNVYDNLYSASMSYSNLIKDLNNISQYSNAFTSGTTHDAFANIFGGILDGGASVNGFIGFVQYGGTDSSATTNYMYTINNVFADNSIQNPISHSKTLFFASALTQIFNGCDSSSKPIDNHFWCAGSQGIIQNQNWIGLDAFYQRANPWATFTLAGMINSFILGQHGVNSNYSVWSLYGSAYTDFLTGHMERVVVGMMISNMMMASMMAYAWYMVGRVFELIILWLGSIIVAFKDDGEGTQFRIIMKAVMNKTLSIIFIEFVFTITNTLINLGFMKVLLNNAQTSSTGMFDASAAAVMMATVILFCASYYMGNSLCTLILGEAGQLRSFGDQYANISSSGRQQYGQGTKGMAGQAAGTLNSGGKALGREMGTFGNFKKLGGSGGMFGNKDFKSFKASGGKKGVPS